jgi:DNA-binding transcriptional regulator WhiA
MISKKKVKEEILENISVEAGDLKAFLYAVTVSSGSLILSDKKLSLTIENDEAVVLLKFIEGLKKEYNVNASLIISGGAGEKTSGTDKKKNKKHSDFNKNSSEFYRKNGEKYVDFTPKNSEKAVNFDPKNGEKTADFDPKNGEKYVDFTPKNDEKAVNFDRKNDKKTAEFNRKNNENSVITERKKRGKCLEIGEKDTASVLNGLCAAEFFEGKLVGFTDGLPEKYRDFEGIKALLQAAFLKNGVLRTPDADDDGGYYMGEKGHSEHGDYDAAGELNSENGINERENSGRGGYYAEVMFDSERLASDVVFELNKYGIKAKILERNESYAVYIKDGESVGGFLALVQAHGNALELQEILVMREERNNSNRRANCDSHNLDKSVEASVGQALAIAKIAEKGGLDALSDELKRTADIRTENPTASLNELAEMLGVSKSCVQHRLKRLADIAGKIGD